MSVSKPNQTPKSQLPEPRLVLRWAITIGIGLVGALAAKAGGLPLPWMLGPLIATGLVVVLGVKIVGAPPAFPTRLRMAFVPVIGVLIGSAFTPAIMASIPSWWPTLLSVLIFVPLAHLLGYGALRHLGGYDRATAYFGAMPGGLIESIELGERYRADLRALTSLQFARIALVVTALPVAYSLAEGRAVGSASGMSFGAPAEMSLIDAAILTLCGVAGYLLARRLHMPAAPILGPLLLSAAAHAGGLTEAAPPGWLVALAQLVIGVTLGLRFVGLTGRELGRHLSFAGINVVLVLGLGALFGQITAAMGGPGLEVMLLSLAPGGVVEMGLIALSLGADAIFVTAHHLIRIIATVGIATAGWRMLQKSAG
ncbi:MAG: AbrB family transcriptional regulator [Paracoccus sp. (in: a-proteobacteria)]|nr:AbrB family transcriptional regulator [Paracoccus sp. (in: a-proteobacteria)]